MRPKAPDRGSPHDESVRGPSACLTWQGRAAGRISANAETRRCVRQRHSTNLLNGLISQRGRNAGIQNALIPSGEDESIAYPKKNEITRLPRKALNVTLWVMQVLAALAFLSARAAKLTGSPMMVAQFQAIGLGQWFRYLTGILEVAGAIALVLPRAAYYGALLLVVVMIGALIAHLKVLGLSTAATAFILLLLTGTIAYFRRAR